MAVEWGGLTYQQWRKLRPLILRRDGYQCRHCGAAVHARRCNPHGCARCPHVDHYPTPRHAGGLSTPSNLVTACQACNLTRDSRQHLTTSRTW